MLHASRTISDLRSSRAASLPHAALSALSALPIAWAGFSTLAGRLRPARATRTPARVATLAVGPALALVLIGAGCMYLYDPDLGAARRERLRQALDGLWERTRGIGERLQDASQSSVARWRGTDGRAVPGTPAQKERT